MTSRRFGVAWCIVGVAGCSGEVGSGGAAAACEPGRQVACACTDGRGGAQTCLEDGSGWAACICDCVPDCLGRDCGTDGCTGSCGDCVGGDTCSAAGVCEAPPPATPLAFTVIPFTAPEIIAPFRGGEVWHDDPPGQGINNISESEYQTPLDIYYRTYFDWFTMEPLADQYDWAIFDDMMESAIGKRQKLSFCVMTLCPGCDEGRPSDDGATMNYPRYLHELMQAEAADSRDWITPQSNVWVPNYNSPNYQARFAAFLEALASHIDATTFDSVPYANAIGYVDICGFGSWGEWHHGNVISTPADYPTGREPTNAAIQGIIDAHLEAFPRYPLVIELMAFDGFYFQNTWIDPYIGYYALTASNDWGLLGWTRKNWGLQETYVSAYLEDNDRSYNSMEFGPVIMERWKYAPVNGEPIQYNASGPCGFNYCTLPDEVQRYHAQSIGNGNFYALADTVEIRDAIREAYKRSGYRLTITGGEVTTDVVPGGPLVVALDWQNVGVSPVYEAWDVTFELRGPSSATVAWSGESSVELKLWLPRGDLPETQATRVIDAFTLPGTLAHGTYDLTVKIIDPTGYRDPLPLAITGRQTDGSYILRADIVL